MWATVALALTLSSTALAERYIVDDTAGKVGFDMVASLHDVHGEAKSFSGELNIDKESTGKMVLQAAQLTTGISVRDSRMYDFCLTTERYPTVEFNVSAVRGDTEGLASKKGSGSIVLHGPLMIRSSSREIAVPTSYAWEGDKLKLNGVHQIKWTDYGVPDPSIVISTLYPEIDVKFDLTLKQAP